MNTNSGMLPQEYIILRDHLVANYNGRVAAGGKECTIRCPFCGDSKSNPRAQKMYVGLNRKRNNVISFNCFKCNSSGDVGLAFFRKLGISDPNVINSVMAYNNGRGGQALYDVSYQDMRANRTYYTTKNSEIPWRNNNKEYRDKLEYINRRIGARLTPNDLYEYKIILNLKDYLEVNGINQITRTPDIVDQLSYGFLGFLSADSSYAILRRLIPESEVHPSLRPRYVNYSITGGEYGSKIYCIREGINPMYPNNICISEGGFDILSLHYNIWYPFPNKIMFASCGKGVGTVLNYIIHRPGMNLFNTVVHAYIDNDITSRDYTRYISDLKSFSVPYVIHNNGYPGEKDFGVPGNHIWDFTSERRQ